MYERMSRWARLARLYLARQILDRSATYQENKTKLADSTGPNTLTDSELDKIIQAIKELPEDDNRTEDQ